MKIAVGLSCFVRGVGPVTRYQDRDGAESRAARPARPGPGYNSRRTSETLQGCTVAAAVEVSAPAPTVWE